MDYSVVLTLSFKSSVKRLKKRFRVTTQAGLGEPASASNELPACYRETR